MKCPRVRRNKIESEKVYETKMHQNASDFLFMLYILQVISLSLIR